MIRLPRAGRRPRCTPRKPAFETLENRWAPARLAGLMQPEEALQVVLVSDAVAQAEQVADAATPGTLAVVYDHETTDFTGLVGLLQGLSDRYDAPIGHLALVAHGNAGQVAVGGGDVWNAQSFRSDAAEWSQLRGLLAEDARIDLYACNVGGGAAGRSFVQSLAAVTGAQVFASTDAVGSGPRADLDWELTVGTGGATGELLVPAALEAIPGLRLEDTLEENDSPTDVNVPGSPSNFGLVTGTFTRQNLMLEDNVDYYRFEIGGPATTAHTVTLSHISANGDLDLYLYGANGTTEVKPAAGGGADVQQINLNGLASGTYYAAVFPRFAGGVNSNYSLQIIAPPDTDEDLFEPNDSSVDANDPDGGANSPNLGLITSLTTLSNLVMDDGADYYRFEIGGPATTEHTVTLSHISANGDLDLYLYGANGTTEVKPAAGGGADVQQINLNGLASGTYYAAVFPRFGAQFGNVSYQLQINPPPDTNDDAFEPNDSSNDANNAGVGANSPNLGLITSLTTLNNLVMDDGADYYRFEIGGPATTAHTVTLSHISANGDLDLYLYGANGTTEVKPAAGGGADVQQINLNGLASGTYYAAVFPRFGAQFGNVSYQLQINPPPDTNDDAFEPNDSPTEAQQNPGTLNSADLGVLTGAFFLPDLVMDDGADYFRFTTTGSSTTEHTVTLSHISANGDLDLYLYGANGTTEVKPAAGGGADVQQINLSGLAAGTYYAAVFPRFGAQFGNVRYELAFNVPGTTESLRVNLASTILTESGATSTTTGTVTRSGSTASDLVVTLTSSDTTEATVPATVTIPAGQLTSPSFTITAVNDLEVDGTRTAVITANAAGLILGRNSVDVLDDDTAGTQTPFVLFSSGNFVVDENDGIATITVLRGGDTGSQVTVNFATSDGDATAGADYTATSGTLTFPVGSSSQTFTVPILDDATGEPTETLNLALSNVSGGGATLGTPNTALLKIIDDDQAPGLFLFGSPTFGISEAGGTATITVIRTGGSGAQATVDFAATAGTATAGSDFTAVNGTLTFPAGVTAVTFTVPVLDDTTTESTETVNLALSNPVGGTLGSPSSATLSIFDDDQGGPTIGGQLLFGSATYAVSESGGTATISVIRTGGTDAQATVDFTTTDGTAIAGSDFTATAGTLTFVAGQTVATFSVPILDDTAVESDETIGLVLSNALNATLATPSSATLTIIDTDGATAAPDVVQFSDATYSVNESQTSVTITVTRMGSGTGAVSVEYFLPEVVITVQGVATPGSDFVTDNGTLTWADGETGPKTFTVTLLTDTLFEPDETVALGLRNPQGIAIGAPAAAVLTILDNDGTANQRYVNRLYIDLLGRPVDESGLSYWGGALDANLLTRSQVVLGLVNSIEYRVRLVKGIYQEILGRNADNAGLVFYVNFLGNGGTPDQLRFTLLGSDEYFRTAGGNNNSSYVDALYLETLDRTADPAGKQFFLDQLNAGVPRAVVASQLVAAPEADRLLADMYFMDLLGRPGDPAGLDFAVGVLQMPGQSEATLIAVLASSNEYFNNAQQSI